MKKPIRVGDTVRYLNDVGGGIVTKICSNTLVEIEDDSGFIIPVSIQELLVISCAYETEEPSIETTPEVPETEIEIIEGNDSPLMLLAFVPQSKDLEQFDIHIINDSNFWCMYVVLQSDETGDSFMLHGTLEPNTKERVCTFSRENIHTVDALLIQAILYKTEQYSTVEPINKTYNIEKVKFHKSGVFTENEFFYEDAYIVELHNSTKQKLEKSFENTSLYTHITQNKKSVPLHTKTKKSREETREVDLHIHELIDNESGLSNIQKLEIQTKAFEKALTSAIKDGTHKLVCIHGVGNGVLKAKIREILDKDYPRLYYQDASFQKYKFGATLIYLRKIYS